MPARIWAFPFNTYLDVTPSPSEYQYSFLYQL